ncbi:HxlR family transcriptional regulator [Amycolatopsis cihanbeyliensis]|uniref:HxlR family transcriptional regulator n=1 Tax=Amycolatopsis cihanbeyliensis TaxID=1128664 RepID=A0A542DCB6_AMYCI|nr:HxlR family transcriptional regulator [Amycolatopsis cihanbeyliensis]
MSQAEPGIEGDAFNADCPGRTVLNHVTSRWGTLILVSLSEGPMRFSTLRDRIGGISEKMLAQNLRVLARDGFVERTVEPSTPPKVSYALTELGTEVTFYLHGLMGWIRSRVGDIVFAQRHHDAHT